MVIGFSSSVTREMNQFIFILRRLIVMQQFWLEPIRIASDYNFNSKELRQISEIIENNIELIKSNWHEYFSK